MSNSTIRYRDAEFVANDLLIEFWMFEAARELDADAGADPWLDELREEWRLQATAGFEFGPSPALDRFLDTDDRRKRLESYFRKAERRLLERSDVITTDELSRAGIGGNDVVYFQSIPTKMVIDVGEQFLSLISAAVKTG